MCATLKGYFAGSLMENIVQVAYVWILMLHQVMQWSSFVEQIVGLIFFLKRNF